MQEMLATALGISFIIWVVIKHKNSDSVCLQEALNIGFLLLLLHVKN